MIVEFTKNIPNVDFGVGGKKTVRIHAKLEKIKNEWTLFCSFIYIVGSDGKMIPIDKTVIGFEFLTSVINECMKDVQDIKEWKHG